MPHRSKPPEKRSPGKFSVERPIWRLAGGKLRPVNDALIEERPVRLSFAGQEAAVLMATPGLERELAAGFALTMGWAGPDAPPPEVTWDEASRTAEVELALPQDAGLGAKAAGGGPLGSEQAPPLESGPGYSLDQVMGFTRAMAANQPIFDLTGASHAAAVFDHHAQMMVLAEDVGRHNAMDKALGSVWLGGGLGRAGAVGFSGRQSVEMVLKVVRAGIGLLAGISAPSARAARKAEELKLTLCGFSRKNRLNIYTHPGRISVEGEKLGAPRPDGHGIDLEKGGF